ncbi:MAG: GDP-mannose 4,6-dehydratase [Rhodopseudomonas sp.]|uniref:GDP-mannose 4,6-dehydratase n=1 Tax=Rhodopseudomonas sp. TaxID=1078 RepID=UPI0039E37282
MTGIVPASAPCAMARAGFDKYLVIGSNSFTGASMVSYLLDQGADVVGISRSDEPHPAFLPYRWKKADRFRFHKLDLNHDLDAIMQLVTAERFPCIINFAAQSMVGESWANPDHWFMTNVVSTVRLHERLRTCDFLERYVHVTTPEVYGNATGTLTEDAMFDPSTPYAVSRAAGDMSLRSYFRAYGFPVLFTRAANVYGPGQRLYRIVPRTILYIKLGRKLQLHGGGTSERSFIHAADVADATRRIACNGKPGDSYHISTDRIVTIRSLVEMICATMGVRFEDQVEIVGERLGKDAAYKLDSSKLRSELGWSDQITLEQGIEQTISWIDRWFEELKSQPFDYAHKP